MPVTAQRAEQPRTKRSQRLLDVVRRYERIAVVMHDNPDPDAIATGWAITCLLKEQLGRHADLIAGGDIIRAENRQMIRLLGPPLQLVDQLRAEVPTAVILVDCGPEATNYLALSGPCQPVAVIDHHDPQRRVQLPFMDIRPRLAASATIATIYLREQRIEAGSLLATALLYAIRSETQGSECCYSPVDRAVLAWLARRADPTLLAQIESAPLSRNYFGDLVLALQSTFLYDDAAFCLLPRAEGPEIIGEVADLLVRCEGVRRVFCGALCGQSVVVSVRTDRTAGNATKLLLEAIRGLGRGGGHEHRAGGKIAWTTGGGRVPDELQDELRNRWLAACGVQRQRGTRLVPRREIIGNL